MYKRRQPACHTEALNNMPTLCAVGNVLSLALTAMAPPRGLGVSQMMVPVALSRAAHKPLSVVLGLPGLGLRTGAGDDLHSIKHPPETSHQHLAVQCSTVLLMFRHALGRSLMAAAGVISSVEQQARLE